MRPSPAAACALVALAGLLLPASAACQRYQLRLAPNPGDTLRMQVEQRTEVTGEERDDTPARTMKAALRIFSHAIVTGRIGDATTLVARTDSVAMDSDDEHATGIGAGMRRFATMKPVSIRLAGDGTVRLLDAEGNLDSQVSATVSLIPAALPQEPLEVGDTWVRSMPLPLGPGVDAGSVRATFRLDSVSRGGRVAFISVRGDLERKAMPAAGPRGTLMRVAGTLAGSLHLDRVRGWIADSRFTVTMHSAVEPPAGSGIQPVKFRTVVTQHMWLRDRPPMQRGNRATPGQPGRP